LSEDLPKKRRHAVSSIGRHGVYRQAPFKEGAIGARDGAYQ